MNKRKFTALTLTAMMAISVQAASVSAAPLEISNTEVVGSNQVIRPQWESTTMVIPSISNSGRSISVSVLITPKSKTEKSVGTVYLQKYSGRRWVTEKSWSIDDSGTVDITKTYTGKSKVKYRTKVVVTTGADKITATSSEITL
ncbi:cell agglutination protein Mam3 [Anaerotignum sp. MB30-C6]|uniref:cell agglutination protein Mam3 n=1 Tax=Anaerotignum sp. MB30-C6 TaxID=3070814 RepID=UPI0027DBF963|nr:cell agglutination protein Mam3 [Anaerotignum sp. MB30-C6]WMI81619.1 cell agglutination protein Mam3 [Anaerotignum sp. MB30-C6]